MATVKKKSSARLFGVILIGTIVMAAMAIMADSSPQFPWQRRCRYMCADALGKRMNWIDSRNCKELQGMVEAIQEHTTLKKLVEYTSGEDVPEGMKDREKWEMAVYDKFEYMNCDQAQTK